MQAESSQEAKKWIKEWALEVIDENPSAKNFYLGTEGGIKGFEKLRWCDFAAIRILDYIENSGRSFANPFRTVDKSVSEPFNLLWYGFKKGTGGSKPLFFEDMIQLFRQLSGKLQQNLPSKDKIEQWMSRWKHGLEPDVIKTREENKERIINILVNRIQSCEVGETRFCFEDGLSLQQKLAKMREWWNDYKFHLRYAVRTPELLNELLDYSLDLDTQKLLEKAKKKGIPFFINPYYLSLLNTHTSNETIGSDLAIRHYVIYSKPLIDQFGNISAWELEDQVEPGKPNAAG